MEKKRPILTIRPRFDPGLSMIEAGLATVGGFLVTTFLLGTFFFLIFSAIGLTRHLSGGSFYTFFMVLSVIAIPPAFYELKKRAYQRTIFNFYEDTIEFQYFSFFLTRRRGRVRYTDITDLVQDASALQEHQNLQSIYIFIPGMAGLRQRQRRSFSGLKIVDVPTDKDYMTVLAELIDARVAAAMQFAPVPNMVPNMAPNMMPPQRPRQLRVNPEPPPPLPNFGAPAATPAAPAAPSSAPAAVAKPAVPPVTEGETKT
jgi:hypothetical protein